MGVIGCIVKFGCRSTHLQDSWGRLWETLSKSITSSSSLAMPISGLVPCVSTPMPSRQASAPGTIDGAVRAAPRVRPPWRVFLILPELTKDTSYGFGATNIIQDR